MSKKIRSRSFTKREILFVGFLFSYAIIANAGWKGYFIWSSPLSWIGLAGIFVLHFSVVSSVRQVSTRYFIPSLCFILLTFLLPVKTFLYFSIAFGLLLLIESYVARGSYVPAVLVIIISPIFNYFITVFTFPIRLKLSWLASKFLAVVDPSVYATGNVIQTGAAKFSVDAECMGLNMVSMGFLIGMLLLAWLQHRTNSEVPFYKIVLFLALIFVLVLVCNFFRIVLLVQFEIPADAKMHEFVGLSCFVLYVMIPITFITQRYARIKVSAARVKEKVAIGSRHILSKNLFMIVFLLVCTAYVRTKLSCIRYTGDLMPPSIPEYQAEMVDKSIVKLQNKSALIYIKPIIGFYSTEHSPMICWKGSGYELQKIQSKIIAGKEVYTAELNKGIETLFTSWWFDDGTIQTIDQLNWRWINMRSGSNFSIVNVTTSSEEQLVEETRLILSNKAVKQLLKK